MAKVTFGRGSIRVNVDDGLARLVEKAVRNSAPRTFGAIDRAITWIEADAKARWPVGRERETVADGKGRPHSRDLLHGEVVIDAGAEKVTGKISQDAEYAYKIKTSQNGVTGNPWQALVAKPLKAALHGIVEEIGKEIKDGASK